MAKPPTLFQFRRGTVGTAGLGPIWLRVPNFNFSGFSGGFTISRVVAHWTLAGNCSTDANGTPDAIGAFAIAITTGQPPTTPLWSLFDVPNTQQYKHRETAQADVAAVILSANNRSNWIGATRNFAESKAQRVIPPSPGGAAVWVGWELWTPSGGTVGGSYQMDATGFVVRLGP